MTDIRRLEDSARAYSEVQDVKVLVHGIRTHAEWEEMVQGKLEGATGAQVIPLRYGRFDTIRFFLPGPTRAAPIALLLRHLRTVRTRFPNARISVLAHSFGTYAIGEILQNEADIRLHRLVLCGSILPTTFRWELCESRVGAMLNDCGTEDVWPVIAASATWGYGASGTFGFGSPLICDRFHKLKHSAFFKPEFVESQ